MELCCGRGRRRGWGRWVAGRGAFGASLSKGICIFIPINLCVGRDPPERHVRQGTQIGDCSSGHGHLLTVGFALLVTVCALDRVPIVNENKDRRARGARSAREKLTQMLAQELEGCKFSNIVGGHSEAD